MRLLDVIYEQIDDATIILHNRDGESLWRGYAYSALPDAYESYRVEEFWDCEVLDVANGGTMTVDIMIDTDTRRMGAFNERNKAMRKRAQEIYTIDVGYDFGWMDIEIPFDPWADDAQVIDVYILAELSNPYDISSVERWVPRLDESEHNADIWYNYVPIDARFVEDWQPVGGMEYADAPNQEALVRYHIDYVMERYDYEENWEDEHAFMAKRKAMRRSAAIKKKAESGIAYRLAEGAAEIAKEKVEYGGYDPDELLSEAVFEALDDGLIYYHQMWDVIEDYGDVQEIWDFIMRDGDVYANLVDDVFLNLGQFFTPDGYSSWEEYIAKNTEDDDDEYTARRRRANVRRVMRRCAQLQEGDGTAISYANALNHIESVMREAYDAHDLNSYNALKRSGDELYEAIIAEGYTINYDQSANTYVVSA